MDARNTVFVDPVTDIYHIIRDYSLKNNTTEVRYVFFWFVARNIVPRLLLI